MRGESKLIRAARDALEAQKIINRIGLVEAQGHSVAIVTKKGKLVARVYGMKLP